MVLSNVDILDKCDSHPSPFRDPKGYSEALSNYTLFKYHGVTLGYLLAPVVAALRGAPWEDWNVSGSTVEFNPMNDTFEKRSLVVKRTVELWRQEKRFEVLAGNFPLSQPQSSPAASFGLLQTGFMVDGGLRFVPFCGLVGF
jgi:hypothetical protein